MNITSAKKTSLFTVGEPGLLQPPEELKNSHQ